MRGFATAYDRWVYRIGSPHLMGHLTFLARMPDAGRRRTPLARLAACPSSPSAADRVFRALRRTLLTLLGVQLALAVGMSLVDSYRRRNKKPKPFPTTPPREVAVGDGTITTYTYGQDLYDDMLAAIEGARSQVLFETYIWKGDEVGERFKAALADAAARGVEVYCIYDSLRQPGRLAPVQALPADDEGAALPVLQRRLAVLRPAPLRARPPQDPRRRRLGRLRRRLQHRVRRTPRSGATPTSGSPGRRCGT